MAKKKYWWCAWCAMWVKDQDAKSEYGQFVHARCGNVVEKRIPSGPIQFSPIDPIRPHLNKNNIRRWFGTFQEWLDSLTVKEREERLIMYNELTVSEKIKKLAGKHLRVIQ